MQDEHSKPPHLSDLPMEMHLYIRNKLITDPETTISQLRSLRLVCKLFDGVWSPVVLNSMSLFPRNPLQIDQIERLVDIVRGKGTTAPFTTLTLQTWDSLDVGGWSFVKLLDPHNRNICISVVLILVNTLLFTPVLLLALVMYPRRVTRDFKRACTIGQARHYTSLLPVKLRLPHLRSIRLCFPHQNRDWTTYQLTKMISAFQHITELKLEISNFNDQADAAQCLRALRNLSKLTLAISHYSSETASCSGHTAFSRLIADNPNIVHLSVYPYPPSPNLVDLSDLFLDVPSDRPLRLEHFSCYGHYCKNIKALLPHFQFLTSLELCRSATELFCNTWCTVLSDAGIFPQTIKASCLDQQLATYLKKHPGLVGLSLEEVSETIPDEPYRILGQHSATLQYLKLAKDILDPMRIEWQHILCITQCTNLREIALIHSGKSSNNPLFYESRVFPIFARVNDSLKVVLHGVRVDTFISLANSLRKSTDPLNRSLAERLLLEL